MNKDFAEKMQNAVKDAQDARIEEASHIMAEKKFLAKTDPDEKTQNSEKSLDFENSSLDESGKKSYLGEGLDGSKNNGFLSKFKKRYSLNSETPSSSSSSSKLGIFFMGTLSEKLGRIRPSFLIVIAGVVGLGVGFSTGSHLQASRVVKMEKEIVALNSKVHSSEGMNSSQVPMRAPMDVNRPMLFSSSMEEKWYADLSRANHGLEARDHCASPDGRVVMQGTDKAACLLWLPVK